MTQRRTYDLLNVDTLDEAPHATRLVLPERIIAEVGRNCVITEVDPRTPAIDEVLTTRFLALDNPAKEPRQFMADQEDDLAAGVMHVAFRLRRGGQMLATSRLHFQGNAMYISRFGVLPEFKRRGIGSAMLRAVEQEARRRHKTLVYLTARPTDESNGFWDDNGFFEDGTPMKGKLGEYRQMMKHLTR